jgi:pyruvate-ferredoxin/flavodoxin oxidoreductase
VINGRYGLGSKEFNPGMIKAVFDNMNVVVPKNHFTIGIEDDVTYTSLEWDNLIGVAPGDTVRCKFWGLGSDGTVGANKTAIKIIGDNTPKYVQGYFAYDSKKSGGLTISHLRIGDAIIQSSYKVFSPEYVACHNPAYVKRYDILEGIKPGGTFVLNSPWSLAEMEEELPAHMRREIARKKIRFFNIDAVKIATEVGLKGRINMIMQTAYFKLFKVIPVKDAMAYLKEEIRHMFGKKGQNVVQMNIAAVDKTLEHLKEIHYPESWADALILPEPARDDPPYIREVLRPVTAQKGDMLPVSVFPSDGIFPVGTTRFEKRGVAINVPEWIQDNCIQCNQCAFVCPHAAIRPFLLTDEEVEGAPEPFGVIKALGKELKGYHFHLQVYSQDCLGCGNCADICPAKQKALVMQPLETQLARQIVNLEYAETLPIRDTLMKRNTIKGSQFQQPLLEFSGACAGCGETPYAKLLTQLFGERMVIGNATGCSSIWGGDAPAIPYCTNRDGHGPTWGNSLFEDPAEFTYGMFLGHIQQRAKLADLVRQALAIELAPELREALQGWTDHMKEAEGSREYGDRLKALLPTSDGNKLLADIHDMKEHFTKRSYWVFVGDGAAYDIAFSGIDHILSTGEDINVLVFDTEVYSNTGGQSSKATPTGAIAKFAASGKKTTKKDMGAICMSYGYVYVANVSMGADKNQLIKALTEAESYDGPSIVMAYSPCINHGIKVGMGKSQEEMKRAVACGYWPLYRHNPELKREGKNPFILDSKAPDGTLQAFLSGEVRYAALEKTFPMESKALRGAIETEYLERYERLKRMAAAEPIVVPTGEVPIGKGGEDTQACLLSETAEHSGRLDAGEECDDSRAGTQE